MLLREREREKREAREEERERKEKRVSARATVNQCLSLCSHFPHLIKGNGRDAPERCNVRAGKSKFTWCIMPDPVEGMSVS